MKWGYLRETKALAEKAGLDLNTGLHRNGLDEYLKVIYPDVNDWLHDKTLGKINNIMYRNRPDYRSEELKLIIEVDGLPHYTNPDIIEKDIKSTRMYENLGYKVVRIPYFIQLTNNAVELLFNEKVNAHLFDVSYPSLNIESRCTPAYLCPAGIERMAREFIKFEEQYLVNINYLKSLNNNFKTGTKLLEEQYNLLKNQS